jgi:cytochrome c oxidase assembly factor CtaG
MERIDSLLRELSSRHRNHDARFLATVRPMVARILDPATPEAARVPLLELLAVTFERDAMVRRDASHTLAAWQSIVAADERRRAS